MKLMKLFCAGALTLLLFVSAAFATGQKPRQARTLTARQEARRTMAERMCKAQERDGRHCTTLARPGAPRDLTGVSCVCQ